MFTATYSVNATIAGINLSRSVVRQGDHPNPYQVTLPAAKAVTDWVKTDADTAAGNLAAGHGLTTGTYDVYWDGGARYGVSVTVTTNALALDGGSGTDFPASSTSTVRISKQKVINTAIDGDTVQIAGILLGYADTAAEAVGRLLFEDAAGDDIADLDGSDGIVANVPKVIDVEGGDTNAFSGDLIATCKASHSNTAADATLTIVTLEDSTP